MRVWDIPVENLCDKHLIAQHHEIHCIYNIITKGLNGFARHPEVMRWRGNLGGLILKHDEAEEHMIKRGMLPNSVLNAIIIGVEDCEFPSSWQPVEKQIEMLKDKGCDCKLPCPDCLKGVKHVHGKED